MPLGESSRGPVAQCRRSWPAQRAWPSLARLGLGLAQLGRRERARGGAARLRCSGDLTDAREAAEESTAGPHRRMDGGAAELVGVDGGVGRHGEAWTPASGGSAATNEDGGGEG
jgi:hypothetical protein